MHAGFRLGNVREKRPLEKVKSIRKDNTKMGLHEIGRGRGLDLSGSGQAQVAGYFVDSNKPPDSIKCGEFLD
jgi:hypothetical protein